MTVVADIMKMLEHKTAFSAEQALEDLVKVYEDGIAAKQSCKSAQDLLDAGIAEYLKVFKVANAQMCQQEIDEDYMLLRSVVDSFKHKNWSGALLGAFEAFMESRSAFKSCTPTLFMNWKWSAKGNMDACQTDMEDAADTVFTIVNEVLNNTVDPTTLVTQVTQVVHDIDKAVKGSTADCQLPQAITDGIAAAEDEFLKHIPVADKAACKKDIDSAIPEVMKLIADIKKNSTFHIALDAAALEKIVTAAEKDCKPTNTTRKVSKHGFQLSPADQKCQKDVTGLFDDAIQIEKLSNKTDFFSKIKLAKYMADAAL